MIAATVMLAAGTSRRAAADIPSDTVEFMAYGRIGIGWTVSGQTVAGKYMNLGDHKAIGGRLEEGDYLEPGMRYHLKKPATKTDTSVDLVTDFEMFSLYGALISDLGNGDISDIKIMPLQAYVEAKNVLTEGLTVWIGSRLYRKNDIHICDYFYFNSLPGQGGRRVLRRPRRRGAHPDRRVVVLRDRRQRRRRSAGRAQHRPARAHDVHRPVLGAVRRGVDLRARARRAPRDPALG